MLAEHWMPWCFLWLCSLVFGLAPGAVAAAAAFDAVATAVAAGAVAAAAARAADSRPQLSSCCCGPPLARLWT